MITTYKCNLNCIMCDLPKMFKNCKDLPLGTIKRIIRESKEIGFKELVLTGGEPLLRDDIFEIIQYAKSKGFIINLNTNATLIENKLLKKLLKSKPSIISISLDGPKKNS